MKIFRNLLKYIIVLFTLLVFVLYIIQVCLKKENPLARPGKFGYFSYNITYVWFNMAGLLSIIKSFFSFKKKMILLGIGTLIGSLLLIKYARYVSSLLFVFIYGAV
jgi:hypothetical protein